MTHQIIRTVQELKALDPDTLIITADYLYDDAGDTQDRVERHTAPLDEELPAVVVATGEQVRAARKALGDA